MVFTVMSFTHQGKTVLTDLRDEEISFTKGNEDGGFGSCNMFTPVEFKTFEAQGSKRRTEHKNGYNLSAGVSISAHMNVINKIFDFDIEDYSVKCHDRSISIIMSTILQNRIE